MVVVVVAVVAVVVEEEEEGSNMIWYQKRTKRFDRGGGGGGGRGGHTHTHTHTSFLEINTLPTVFYLYADVFTIYLCFFSWQHTNTPIVYLKSILDQNLPVRLLLAA